eukprot:Platyproteum_vivax@DN8476_c0_g1_i1.p1
MEESVEVKQVSAAVGQGVFATRPFTEGELVVSGKSVSVSDNATQYSIQTDMKTHVLMALPAVNLNHSCDANLIAKLNDKGAYDFIAKRDIKRGEQVTFDYDTTEYCMSAPVPCACGTPLCRKIVAGFSKHTEHMIKTQKAYLAPYILQHYANNENEATKM